MSKNTSILLSKHYENFVNEKIDTGKYASISEVVTFALKLLESEEKKIAELIIELEIGEKSGIAKNFNRQENLKKLHQKFLN